MSHSRKTVLASGKTNQLTQVAGVMYDNYHLSVILCAYLYFALRLRDVVRSWPAMDDLIEEHLDSIFFGTLPQDAEQIYKRFRLRMDISPTSQVSDCRRKIGKRVQITPSISKTRLQPSCLAKNIVLLCDYFEGKQSMLQTTYAVDSTIKKTNASNKTKNE